MIEYQVLNSFVDLQDSHHIYHTGDIFPRMGAVVSEERIAYLAGAENKSRKPYIVPVGETVAKKETVEEPELLMQLAEAPTDEVSTAVETEEPKPKKSKRSK